MLTKTMVAALLVTLGAAGYVGAASPHMLARFDAGAMQPSYGGQSPTRLDAASEPPHSPAPAPKYAMVDGHLHFFNVVQETFGLDALFNALDQAGVTETVVLGMPLVKTWEEGDATRPTYYLDNDSTQRW